ncbi:MAG: hypothetical protein ACYSU0_04080 [Planctomycetota bacterium]|jgi:hypothetical protein
MSPSKRAESSREWRPWLGILAVVCYGIHASRRLAQEHPEELLWACHMGALAVGVGLLCRWRSCLAVGFLWLTLGIPLWGLNVLAGGNFLPTSPFSHLGGWIVGALGLRETGLPGRTWWKASAALVPLFFLCRWATPEEANVNLAFAIWPGWEKCFPSHSVYVLAVLALSTGVFLATEVALRKLGFRDAVDDSRDGTDTGPGGRIAPVPPGLRETAKG